MKKGFIMLGLFVLLGFSFVSANTILEIQTAPLKDVWVTAVDSQGAAIKVPEMHSVDKCGRIKIDYNISELSFNLMIRVKEGDAVFFHKTFEDTFYKDTNINLTALPEGYNLELPDVCYEVDSNSFEENTSLNEVQVLENYDNDSESISEEENLEIQGEDSGFFITGFSFSKGDVFNANNLIYLVVLILIILVIFLLVKNRNKDHLLYEYGVSNKFPVKRNTKKIEKLKKKIEKYEKKIIELRQEDLNPHSREKFKEKRLKKKDVLGSEKNDRVSVSDLEKEMGERD